MDGSGHYQESPSAADAGGAISRDIRVSPEMRQRLFAGYAIVKSERCETRQKHIADTGTKTLTYRADGAGSSWSCTFNYSDSDKLDNTADAFLSIAETVQAGERLAQKHRYDRLGLDAEIDAFLAEVKLGHAIEVANIAPVLRSIAEDERVMERVRRKASRLLQESGAGDSATGSLR